MFAHLTMGFANVFEFNNLMMIILGTLVGYFIGAMPGLTPSIGIALLIPFTFTMDAVPAMLMLVCLYIAAEYGGGITAILINAPGTPAAAATALDGYPLAKRGEAGKALTISILASGWGSLISSILLVFTAIPMAKVALSFGPAEYFALAVFGLSLISSLSEGSLIKGILGMCFGLILITIGMDPVNGVPRFAFTNSLFGGIPFLPALIGLFALSEVLFMVENADEKPAQVETIKGIGIPFSTLGKMKLTLVRSPIIGYVVGVIPGAGATIASWISYNEARRVSKESHTFGTGNPEGIAASEAANNAAVPGALAPLLALGIPGSASAAILIGALTIQGLQPGPLLFVKNPEIPYSIFAALIIAAPFMTLLGLFGARLWVKVTLIPTRILAVIVAGITILGSYSYSNDMYSVWVMFIGGIVGYIFRKVKIPTTPVVLAMVLGFMMEVNLRRALIVSGGNPAFVLTRPISLFLLVVSVITLIVPIIKEMKGRRAQKAEA